MCRLTTVSGTGEAPDNVRARETSTSAPPWFVAWGFPDDRVYVVDGKVAEQWVLEFVGRFSALQNVAEHLISMYLMASSPRLGKEIERKHLGRLTDQDRWDYVKALTWDVGYQGNLVPSASDAFWRCKLVRDFVSHHTGMSLLRDWDSSSYYYKVPDEWRKPQMPDPLTPETFRKLANECRWLEAFIDHIAYLSGVRFISAAARVNADGDPEPQYLEIMEPPPLPVPANWDKAGLARNKESPCR